MILIVIVKVVSFNSILIYMELFLFDLLDFDGLIWSISISFLFFFK